MLKKHYEESDKKHLFLTELKIFFYNLFGLSEIEEIKSNELDMWVTKICERSSVSYFNDAPQYVQKAMGEKVQYVQRMMDEKQRMMDEKVKYESMKKSAIHQLASMLIESIHNTEFDYIKIIGVLSKLQLISYHDIDSAVKKTCSSNAADRLDNLTKRIKKQLNLSNKKKCDEFYDGLFKAHLVCTQYQELIDHLKNNEQMQRITNELINTPVKQLVFSIALDSYANPQDKQGIYDYLKIEIKNLSSQDKEQCKEYLHFLANNEDQKNTKLHEYILEIEDQIPPQNCSIEHNNNCNVAIDNNLSLLSREDEKEIIDNAIKIGLNAPWG